MHQWRQLRRNYRQWLVGLMVFGPATLVGPRAEAGEDPDPSVRVSILSATLGIDSRLHFRAATFSVHAGPLRLVYAGEFDPSQAFELELVNPLDQPADLIVSMNMAMADVDGPSRMFTRLQIELVDSGGVPGATLTPQFDGLQATFVSPDEILFVPLDMSIGGAIAKPGVTAVEIGPNAGPNNRDEGAEPWRVLDTFVAFMLSPGDTVRLRSFTAIAEADLALPVLATFPLALKADGDGDFDGDVDLADFLLLSNCFSGPDRVFGATACQVFDFDADGNIDLSDGVAFLNVLTGAR